MKKSLLITLTTILLLGLTMSSVWANAYSLEAENGRILAPAGLGLHVSGDPAQTSELRAQASYGIAKYLTVGADWHLKKDDYQQLFLKASLSPTRKSSGYTAYVEYYPASQEFTDYGFTLWNNFGFLYTFVNLDARKDLREDERGLTLTPGVSVKITPRVRLAAELAVDPTVWEEREIRVGVGYQLADRLTAKTNVSQTLDDEQNRTFTAGLSLEL